MIASSTAVYVLLVDRWKTLGVPPRRISPTQLRKIREAREAVDARFVENAALLMERQAEKQTSATRRQVYTHTVQQQSQQ